MKAVEEWRNAGKNDSNVKIVSSQSGSTGPIISGRAVAENLAKELEAEQEKVMQKYKLEIEKARQLQVNRYIPDLLRKYMSTSLFCQQEARRKENLSARPVQTELHDDSIASESMNSYPYLEADCSKSMNEEEPEISGSYFDESMVRDTSHRSKRIEVEVPVPLNRNDNSMGRDDILSELGDEKLTQDYDQSEPEFHSYADVKLLESHIGHSADVSEGDYIVEELTDDD
jgi:hypothetical protein